MGNVHGGEESGTDAAASRPLRARRPHGLRRDADPRQRARRDHRDAEPGRPRGRAAAERLLLRHEPRLVRPDAARDRGKARALAAVPGRHAHRRPRDGREALLLPTGRGSDLPRGDGGVGRASPISCSAPRCGRSSIGSTSSTSTTRCSTSSRWSTATRSRRVAFGSGGMTFEKANFHPIAARTYEQYVAHWVSLSAAATNRERMLLDWHGSWVDALTQGDRRAARSRTASTTRATPSSFRCRTSGCGTTSSARTTPTRRPRSSRSCGACSGWTSPCTG